MSSREIVTFQLGHYSNFVGTHWWNLQEASFVYHPSTSTEVKEINHDVLFREGENLMREVTYTPRLISLDLKGSLNTLRQEGKLYDVRVEEDVHWEGDVTLHSSITPPKNEFLRDLEQEDADETIPDRVPRDDREFEDSPAQSSSEVVISDPIIGTKFYNLDSEVKVWSDFLRIHLHPRSLNVIEDYTYENETEQFDIFGCGEGIFSNYDRRADIEDQIHFFTEESDNLQGFHLLSDTYNGFGGVASWITQYLEDEFPNKGSLSIGVHPAHSPEMNTHERIHRIISTLLSYDKMVAHSSLFVPISMTTDLFKPSQPPVSLPYLKYQSDLKYHTSAVLAAALDTVTLPYRQESDPSRLTDITHAFHHLGRKVAGISLSLPFPVTQSGTLVESLMDYQGRVPWTSITPGVTGSAAPYMQSVVLRGIPDKRIKSRNPRSDLPKLLSQCDTGSDILKLYITEMFPRTLNAGCMLRQPCKVTSPFPHVFSPLVSPEGWVSDTERMDKQGVNSVPVMTSLQSSPELGSFLQQLHTQANKINIKKYHQFLENGLEEDDYKETLEHVASLCICYES